MKYLLMVGHGQFPPGLHNALTMFASDTPDLMYCNLENGMDTDKYVENLKKKLEVIHKRTRSLFFQICQEVLH